MWPDNERALAIFERVGSRWNYHPAGGTPYGLRWESIYPLMDSLELTPAEWNELLDELAVMESVAVNTMREFAPKPKH